MDRETACLEVRKKVASLLRNRVLVWASMLTEYLRAAMSRAHYELLGDGEGFYVEIPECQGVYAQASTLEACREELRGTLEDWLLFRISRHLSIPTVGGIDLSVKEVEPIS